MGLMKDFDIRIRNGGDDAIAAVGELTAHLEGEVERLRSLTRFQDRVIRSGDTACLTQEERLSIQWVIGEALAVDGVSIQATLRGLLERTQQPANTRDQQPRTKEAAHMSNENERSVASAGSVAGKPMAWAVMQPDSYSVFLSKLLAEKRQELCMGGDIIPLYRHAQPTLTDAERKAVKWAAKQMQYINADNAAAILRGLLDRLG